MFSQTKHLREWNSAVHNCCLVGAVLYNEHLVKVCPKDLGIAYGLFLSLETS